MFEIMGVQMPTMIVTVVLAHAVYGLMLGLVLRRSLPADGWLLSLPTAPAAAG